MKQLLGIRQCAETIIEDRQSDHHEHRWKNKSRKGSAGAAPSAQTVSNIGDSVARARARQALTEGQRFYEVMLAQPAPFENYDVSDLGEDGKTAAESGQSDFKKREKESAQGGGPRNLF